MQMFRMCEAFEIISYGSPARKTTRRRRASPPFVWRDAVAGDLRQRRTMTCAQIIYDKGYAAILQRCVWSAAGTQETPASWIGLSLAQGCAH
jgi:hypothetical protein